jgi:hypothetical protein
MSQNDFLLRYTNVIGESIAHDAIVPQRSGAGRASASYRGKPAAGRHVRKGIS